MNCAPPGPSGLHNYFNPGPVLALVASPAPADLAIRAALSSRSGIPRRAVVNASDITSLQGPSVRLAYRWLRSSDTWGTSSQFRP